MTAPASQCGVCKHDVDMHYDMGCVGRKSDGSPCKCIASWRDEPLHGDRLARPPHYIGSPT